MRIGIYNKHFQTLEGGGERRTAALAEHLSRSHDVTLYVLEPPDLEAVRSLFGIDLHGVDIVPLVGKNHFDIIAISKS